MLRHQLKADGLHCKESSSVKSVHAVLPSAINSCSVFIAACLPPCKAVRSDAIQGAHQSSCAPAGSPRCFRHCTGLPHDARSKMSAANPNRKPGLTKHKPGRDSRRPAERAGAVRTASVETCDRAIEVSRWLAFQGPDPDSTWIIAFSSRRNTQATLSLDMLFMVCW